MPAFKDTLTEDEIDEISQFIANLELTDKKNADNTGEK